MCKMVEFDLNTTIDRQQILAKLSQALNSGELSVFVGAGISKGAGYFDWKELLKEEAKNIKLDIEKERDLPEVAQYICNAKNRATIDNLINEAFPSNLRPNVNHVLLAKLPIDTFWTTNYDKLIEKALDLNGKTVAVKSEDQHLQLSRKNHDAVIYKMHGDIEHPDRAVITRNDYEKYGFKDRVLFRDVLEGHLLTKTFLFMGFSFTDPNFLAVLSKMRILLDGRNRNHYCILREISNEDYKEESEYVYEKARQKLVIDDLRRSGIFVHLIKSYSEITEILDDLYKIYRRKTIFISGSADSYAPLNEAEAKELISRLAYGLVEKGYQLVNGYGKGIGSYVIDGVSEYCYSNNRKNISDYLTLMPFPLSSATKVNLKETWSKYREEMISSSGIAVAMFGNKKEGENLLIADGVIEEVDLANKFGLDIVTLNFTGGAAKEIGNHKEFSGMKIEGFVDVETTVKEIIEIIDELSKRW